LRTRAKRNADGLAAARIDARARWPAAADDRGARAV